MWKVVLSLKSIACDIGSFNRSVSGMSFPSFSVLSLPLFPQTTDLTLAINDIVVQFITRDCNRIIEDVFLSVALLSKNITE